MDNIKELEFDELLDIYLIVKEYIEYLNANMLEYDEGEQL